MKRRKVSPLFILGISLIVISLLAMLIFQIWIQTGSRKSQQIVSKLSEVLPDRVPGIPGTYPTAGMPVLELDGVDYMAVIEIPAFDVKLPVSDQWGSKNLACAPARFFGSAYDHTLIIGGGDYPGQFGFCDKIEYGTLVTVTDMTGAQFRYTVSRVDRAKHAQAQWLTDGNCDLTLFCHDLYSMEYIAVRCTFAY